jgi:hypothetical protein
MAFGIHNTGRRSMGPEYWMLLAAEIAAVIYGLYLIAGAAK